MGQHLATHTELWGLNYHRLGCIHKVLVCNCLQNLFKHVQPCKLPFNNSCFCQKFALLQEKKCLLIHSYVCVLGLCTCASVCVSYNCVFCGCLRH